MVGEPVADDKPAGAFGAPSERSLLDRLIQPFRQDKSQEFYARGHAPDEPLTDRMAMLPVGQYANGDTAFAWPGMLKDMYEGAVRSYEQGRQLPRVDEQGNYAGTPRAEPLDAFNAASIAPVGTFGARAAGLTKDVGDLGMFAGRGAKTADHAKLAQAEKMAAEGTPRERIWNDTGWFQGVDGKWRFEIDDSAASKTSHGNGPLSKVMAHDGLYKAYPDVAGIRTVQEPGFGASYYAGNPGPEEITYQGPLLGRLGSWISGVDESPAQLSNLLHEAQHAIQHREGMAPGARFGEAYRRSAGEVEARGVQARQRLTPEQRAARPPWLDYDVPEPSQLFANDSRASLPAIVTQGVEGAQPQGIRAYHWSPEASEIGPDNKFFPMSHFGTKKAAADRYESMVPDEELLPFLSDLGEDIPQYGGTFPVDLDIKNPLRVPDIIDHTNPTRVANMVDAALKPSFWQRLSPSHLARDVAGKSPEEAAAIVDAALGKHGYDGLVYKNVIEGGGDDSYIATRPGTVRSATTGEVLYVDPATASVPANVLNLYDRLPERAFAPDSEK
jgi:hypothetical protein